MECATNKNMTVETTVFAVMHCPLSLHRDDNLTMSHQKGTEYSASKLIRKGKPVTTNLNLQLMNMAEHIKSPYQNWLLSTIIPEVNCKQTKQGLES